jgi:hypothetical protein
MTQVESRDDYVYMAKLNENAERYSGMSDFLHPVPGFSSLHHDILLTPAQRWSTT